MADKTGLYVFTGFLGAGKTTILLRLLDILKDKRVGIIQNEFGKLSIDGEILRNDVLSIIKKKILNNKTSYNIHKSVLG